MKNDLFVFASMAFVESEDYLRENTPDEILSDELGLLRIATLLNQLC